MKQIGVIDCGSNSFTLVIARVEEGHWVREFANSLPVGLGAGGFRNATIRADRFARGLDALGVFRETLRNYGVDAVYVTGTSALRDARNADEFVKAVADRLDLAVEVISGAQEAFAIWKGASLTEPLEGEDVGLLMDIGGGSVEFAIWPNGGAWKWLKSVDAGVVRMKDYAKPQDPLQQQGADRLLPFIDEVLAPVHAAIAEWRPNVLVGSSGSFDAMASLLRRGEALPDEGAPHATAERLDRSALKVLHREALAAPLTERLAWKGMPSSRAPYLPLASVLVQNVLQHLDAASPVPVRVARSPYALREGLVELAVGGGFGTIFGICLAKPQPMTKVLIIDDEAPIRNSLRELLEEEGCRVEVAEDGAKGLSQAVKFAFDLIFCDIKMPRMDGMDVLDMLKEKGVTTPVVMISGHGTVDVAVRAIKEGAFDFIEKPLDLNRIIVTLRHVTERKALQEKAVELERALNEEKTSTIVGESQAIRSITDRIATVAPTDARVLVTGPNGSGKELVARQLHALSNRSHAPFIEVNCAAIPSELIESELFGHEKGAFTSAVKQRKGKFELAHGGTLFLDEIGDMSPSAQAKVLRALQENRITRVGGDEDIAVDVRIVAATNRNLLAEIDGGQFREDLYHRLAVILVEVPPLNDRREDVPLLVNHFLGRICGSYNVPVPVVQSEAMRLLQEANWRGNIRELRNVVERLVILTPKGEEVTAEVIRRNAGLSER